MKLVPVILSGGVGSRLWPVSRTARPKPFIELEDGRSLLQHAYLRAVSLPGAVETLTVTNASLLSDTTDAYEAVHEGGPASSFILEPAGRDTAAAAAVAALHIERTHGPDALGLLLPADHVIGDEAAFRRAVAEAGALATAGRLVTFGVEPRDAETAYGYVEADGGNVVRFTEKPSREKAEEYVRSGRFLWNAGMLCFPAGRMVELLAEHCGEIMEHARQSLLEARPAGGEHTGLMLDAESFAKVPALSLDFALLEKVSGMAVVRCEMGWRDIGSWAALAELTEPDSNANRIRGEAITVDTRNCYIQAENRLVGAVGIDGLVIVDSPDALLIGHRDALQKVKALVEAVKSAGNGAHELYRTVHRSWGTYTVIEQGERFKVKRLEVKPGASLSLQMHRHRSEHWVVVSGVAEVANGEETLSLEADQSTYIPPGRRHRLKNPGKETLVLIEVQSGDYLGEDDIIRLG